MSLGPALDAKERVRQAIDIVELVGEYVPLRRQGRQFVGICPWHNDSRPSLSINPERQSWKCWVCDIGGDVFSFLMKVESLSFPEALKALAERAGIEIDRHTTPQQQDEKRDWYQTVAWAERLYHECLLRSPEADEARRYLQNRGVTANTIQRFHLGFAPPSWDWLLKQARAARIEATHLEKMGLVLPRQEGQGFYDRFRGRVMFPIRDAQGRPVAFGGRILPSQAESGGAKYINSPETPLFAKSRMLYALDVARDAMARTRSVVVVEGYTDCLAAHQAGFEHVVAVLGTALGERHVQLLKRYVDRVILLLDGDEAGQRRTSEVLELFVAEQADLRIATLPEGLDPAEFLEQRGAEAFGQLLDEAVDALEHKFRTVAARVDAESDMHAAHQALEEVLATLGKAPKLRSGAASATRLREDQILHRLARRFGVPEESLRARLGAMRQNTRPRGADRPPEATPAERIDPWERELLEVLIQQPDAAGQICEAVRAEDLRSDRARRLFQQSCELWERGTLPTFDNLMLAIDDPTLQSLLVDLDEQGRAKGGETVANRLNDVLASFRLRVARTQTRAQTQALEERRLGDDEALQLLDQILRQERSRHGISAPTDG